MLSLSPVFREDLQGSKYLRQGSKSCRSRSRSNAGKVLFAPLRLRRARSNTDRAPDMIPRGLVMKRDGKLDQSLTMPTRRQIARQESPDILQHFMGLEKMHRN